MSRRKSSESKLESVELEFHRMLSGTGKDVFSLRRLLENPRMQRLARTHESLVNTRTGEVRKTPGRHITADDIIRGARRR